MEVKTNKNGIWVLKDNIETLIWEDELTEDMEVMDLTPVTVDSLFIENLRQSITEEEYQPLINEINNGEIREQINQEVIDEKYEEYRQIVYDDPWIPDSQKEATIQEMIDAEVEIRVDAYARGVIEDEVQAEIKRTEKENAHKASLREKSNST